MSDDVSGQSFEDYVASERERLASYRSQYVEMRENAIREIENIDREFAAIEAYEAAKLGKAKPASVVAPRARRARWGEAVMQMLSSEPLGMTRGELIAAFGVKGDKSGEASVTNALSAMQKRGTVMRHDNGRWAVVATGLHEAA